MRTLSGLMEPTGGGRGHDLFLIFGRVDNVNTPRRARLELGAPLHNPYGQNESCCRTAAIHRTGKFKEAKRFKTGRGHSADCNNIRRRAYHSNDTAPTAGKCQRHQLTGSGDR